LEAREVEWRAQADVAELLHADLRAFLGARYELLGRAVARHLGDVPSAKVVRRAD
jgi:hypothetical protein